MANLIEKYKNILLQGAAQLASNPRFASVMTVENMFAVFPLTEIAPLANIKFPAVEVRFPDAVITVAANVSVK